jgi:hypothetical protein
MDDIAQSPLLQKIQDALLSKGNKYTGIRISISKEAHEFKDTKSSEVALMKSLCWNLTTRTGGYLTDPVLAVVHAGLTEAAIEADLRKFFPGRKAIVDNDIYIDDDQY